VSILVKKYRFDAPVEHVGSVRVSTHVHEYALIPSIHLASKSGAQGSLAHSLISERTQFIDTGRGVSRCPTLRMLITALGSVRCKLLYVYRKFITLLTF